MDFLYHLIPIDANTIMTIKMVSQTGMRNSVTGSLSINYLVKDYT